MSQTAQELLRSNAGVRAEFSAWAQGKIAGDVDKVIDTLQSATWRLFGRSVQGKRAADAVGVESLGAFVVRQSTIPAVTMRVKEAISQTEQAIAQARALQPVEDTPAVVAPAEPAISSAEQGLLSMLAAGLKSVGFVPDQAITAQRAEEIAFEQAQAVVTMVLEDLEKQGKLGTARHVIEVREPGKPAREVDGKVPVWFDRLYRLAQCRIPALLVGPAGCGKTTAVRMLAEVMDLPFYRVSLSAGVDEGCLQGWLLPVSDGGQFSYVQSTVVKAYTEGGVVLLDELDAADANMLIILSAVLDNGSWHIPLRHEQPVLKRHADFVVVAAANTWGHGASRQFVGAQQLDERTLSRFRMGQIACDYDKELEQDLYDDRAVSFGHMLRARCRALSGWQRDVSTRDIESAHAKLAAFGPDECWYEYFADWSEDEIGRVHAQVNHDAMTATLA